MLEQGRTYSNMGYLLGKEVEAMKWQNRGHEFDELAETYTTLFQENGEKIYIFGAGYLGGEVRDIVEHLGCFGGYIDNDVKKQRSGAEGSRVMSLGQYMNLNQKGIVVVAVEKFVSEIEKQLEGKGLSKGNNYFIWDVFLQKVLPLILAYHYNFAYVELAQISVTERCSLRCRKCAHACSYVPRDAKDLTIEEVYQSADAFFSRVDLCREFVLIGGEPLLYKHLTEAVEYIGKKYRNQMIRFCITTNGTILPQEELLDACRKFGVMFRISNYSEQVPYLNDKYQTLIQTLSANEVRYAIADPDGSWMDYGFDYMDRSCDDQGLQKVFEACRTPCREIRGSRYYFCVMARSVSENMGFGVGEDDFLDLEKLHGDYKKILMEFELGYSEKGYLDMCRHCNGADAKALPIPVAEQVSV